MSNFYNVSRHSIKELRKISTLGASFADLVKHKYCLSSNEYTGELANLDNLIDLLASLIPSSSEEFNFLANTLCSSIGHVFIYSQYQYQYSLSGGEPSEFIQILTDHDDNIFAICVPSSVCEIPFWVKKDA